MDNVVLITTDGCIGACACCREMLRLNGLTSCAPFPCVATAETCPTCITTVDSPPDSDSNTHGHPQPQEHPPHSTTHAPPYWGGSSSACLLAAIQPCPTCCCHRFGTMLARSHDSQAALDAAVTMWSEFSVGEAPECNGAHAGCVGASIVKLMVRRGS